MSSMHFSNRVRAHPRIAAFQPQPADPLSLAVDDHLLVCLSAWPKVEEELGTLGAQADVLAKVFDGIALKPGGEDANIVSVRAPGMTIFELTDFLRGRLGPDDAHKVSPNHVLIPAPAEGHGCPHGPPSPLPRPAVEIQPATDLFVPVTIIDSGYIWDQDAWGDNPLAPYGFIWETEAQTLKGKIWDAGTPDVLDANDDGALDALAGHANFIAGVIAQRCTHAELTIRNHNGGFNPRSDNFPTEAAVARSLAQSEGASVINLGFAFHCFGDEISCVWDTAFNQIGDDAIVVAPAGNQDSPHVRYPAGLASKYWNMVGVGSIDGVAVGGKAKKSAFSNHGNWVTCSTRGSKVFSTFLYVDMPVEEDNAKHPKNRDFTKSSWARWNGTSFATPKVVAELAQQIVTNPQPLKDTLTSVLDTGTPTEGLGSVIDV
jgi:thermitase